MPEPTTLAEAVAALGPYPEDHPQSLRELLDADPDTIHHPLAWFLRREAVEVHRSAEKHYINGPKDALKLLKNKYVLHPWTGKWVAYALSGSRQVIMVPHPKGGTTPMRKRTPIIPKVDDLPRLPRATGAASKQPAWLIIHGGGPEVLSKPGVAKGLATLQRRTNVADVLFYSSTKDGSAPPTLWSVRTGLGVQETGSPEGCQVDFPDTEALNEVRRVA